MNLELEPLIALQSLDKQILALQETLKNIPSKIRSVEKPLLDARLKHDSQKKIHESLLKKKKETEFLLDEINDKIKKEKERSSQIKTNREYQAHLKGIENLDSERLKIEDELLVLMEQSDEIIKELKKAENAIKEEEKAIEEFRKTLGDEAGVAEKELDSLKFKRTAIAEKIGKEVYDLYMKQLESGQGLAVVEVKDEICQGCYMNIPPQLYVEVRKGDNLYNCPQCRRFLYFLPEQEKEKA
ncbi:putative zinc ribbon domain protein [bacterium BMS3Abin07]|nr:putative zinc ribbon domain protein [bacterium BMS3Abin07]GBE32272.1 putative zinc ribbon domain protein [bacterium BMS3Bbin05]HDO22817.1 hypothetical protein [Nitrospirota bacterium]HDZ88741.1 hypothetical protein [Nitrospirota bacterium]